MFSRARLLEKDQDYMLKCLNAVSISVHLTDNESFLADLFFLSSNPISTSFEDNISNLSYFVEAPLLWQCTEFLFNS